MSGVVNEADWDTAVLTIEDKLGEQASVHLDWEKLEGLEKGHTIDVHVVLNG